VSTVVSRNKTKRRRKSPPSRPPGDMPRKHHMQTDLTSEQKRVVLEHCAKQGISVSQFLAELAVADAKSSLHREDDDEQEITLKIRIPRDKSTKLAIFAQRRGETVEDHVSRLLLPWLEKQKTSFSLQTESLRYYLDDAEHTLVMKQLKKRGLSARNYVSFLAMQALNKSARERK
jgi:hypothetical protein